MRLITYKNILLILTIAGCLYVGIDTLITEPVNAQNTVSIKGHFKGIRANRPGRGSLNYDLFIMENDNTYKIGANYADCFYYSDFIKQINENQPITFSIRKTNALQNPDIPFVVSIASMNREYLTMDCVNAQLKNDKKVMPLYVAALIILAIAVFKYKTQKEKKIKPHTS